MPKETIRTGLIMLMAGAAFCLSSTAIHSAHADETSSYRGNYIEYACKGYIDKFVLNYTLKVDPANPVQKESTLEVGLVLKKWQSDPVFQTPQEDEASGNSFEVEGIVGAGKGSYTVEVPHWEGWYQVGQNWYSYIWTNTDAQLKSNTTSVGINLKTNLIKGKTKLNCVIAIRTFRGSLNLRE